MNHDPVLTAHNMMHLLTCNSAFCWRAKHERDVCRYAETARGLYNDRVEGYPNLTLTSAEVELDHPFSPTVQHHLVDGPFRHPVGVCSWSNIGRISFLFFYTHIYFFLHQVFWANDICGLSCWPLQTYSLMEHQMLQSVKPPSVQSCFRTSAGRFTSHLILGIQSEEMCFFLAKRPLKSVYFTFKKTQGPHMRPEN